MNTPSPNTFNEVKDLALHMDKVALMIRCQYCKPHDTDLDAFAIQLYDLSAQIKTFIRGKACLGSNEAQN